MVIMWMSHRYLTQNMVIWKENDQRLDDSQPTNDSMTVREFSECEFLKYFRTLVMRVDVLLLYHLIRTWDLNNNTSMWAPTS